MKRAILIAFACACSSAEPLSLRLSPALVAAGVPVEIVTDPSAQLEVQGLPIGASPFFTTHPDGRRDLTITGTVADGIHPLTVVARAGDRSAMAHLDVVGGWQGEVILSVEPSTLVVTQGGSATAMITRSGAPDAIDVFADSLPASVRVEPFTIPANQNDALLRVTVGPEAKLGLGQMFVLRAKGSAGVPVALDVRAASGTLDMAFGKGGVVVESVLAQGQSPIDITSAVRQPDGKLVVVGNVYLGSAAYDVLVVRYMEDGTVDPTFGTNGVVTTDLGTSDYDVGAAVALQTDGKIVVAGNHAYAEMAVVRYQSNGALDAGFATNGIYRGNAGTTYSTGALGVAIQNDGAIVASGWSSGVGKVLRLTPSGALDMAFGSGGTITGATGAFPAVAVQPDQKLVIAGYDTNDVVVWRRNVDGSPDTSFAGTGERIIDFASGLDRGQSIAIQKDGSILVGGTIVKGPSSFLAIARLGSDGTLDASFGTAGKTLVAASGGKGGAPLFLQSDGKILVGGGSSYNGTTSTVLARVLPSGVLDPSFDGTGVVFVNTGSKDQWWDHIDMQADGKIVAIGLAGDPIKNTVMARFWP